MKKLLILIITIGLCTDGCIKEEETETKYFLVNETAHNIEFRSIDTNLEFANSEVLSSNKTKEFNFVYSGKGSPYSLFIYQFVEVIYDDTISIIHGDEDNPVKRDLHDIESYEGGITDESKYSISYEYTYKFTEADYQEALELQNAK